MNIPTQTFQASADSSAALQPTESSGSLVSHCPSQTIPSSSHLAGKRVAMVMFSSYPEDPRPRRAADALREEGASIDLICLAAKGAPKREILNGIDVRRVAIKHRRGGKLAYAYQYLAFIL